MEHKASKKIRVGVIGGRRGHSMMKYCQVADNAELVAICDFRDDVLDEMRNEFKDHDIAFFKDYDEFLTYDMDAVVLANYANEHAPFAIKAMKSGKHVFSEVLPVQTMKEAVELIETVEQTGLVYAYGENYCYMAAPYEMRKLYREGKIGELEYAEGEYVHNCEPIWSKITYGEEDHWRNNIYATFYCTHSLGPIIHISSLRPVSVTGFVGQKNERNLRCGSKSDLFGIEMVTLENGAIVKSIHGGLYKNSIWYTVYGSKGRMECGREDARDGHIDKIYINSDDYSGAYGSEKYEAYQPDQVNSENTAKFGHGGSDFYSMYNFIEKILGNENADTIDVYEALDMFLPGMFAYRSALNGGKPTAIPNLRDKVVREIWRNDTACTDPKVAGDMLLPTSVSGTPDIDPAVYAHIKSIWDTKKNK